MNEFQCKISKYCISKAMVCDYHYDCGENDTSDEGPHCRECSEFECLNGNCISYSELCNGFDDCG